MSGVRRRDGLTPRQTAFVKAYCGEAKGNATLAARLAGYANPNKAGIRLVQHPALRAAIAERPFRPDIADPEEVRASVTAILRDPEAAPSVRLRAAEVLAKIIPFLAVPQRTELSGPDGGPVKVAQLEQLSDEDLEKEIARARAIAGEGPRPAAALGPGPGPGEDEAAGPGA